MVVYKPIGPHFDWDSDFVELKSYDWLSDTATFAVEKMDFDTVSVRFPAGGSVRIVDELALSTESHDTAGIIPHHFAYVVEGDRFFSEHSSAWLASEKPIAQFRFLTGHECLDVISNSEPEFTTLKAGKVIRAA